MNVLTFTIPELRIVGRGEYRGRTDPHGRAGVARPCGQKSQLLSSGATLRDAAEWRSGWAVPRVPAAVRGPGTEVRAWNLRVVLSLPREADRWSGSSSRTEP